jgi:ketosteroid isomerase-like protein
MAATPEEIQRFVDATNRGDTDAFVEAFTEDAHLDDWGRSFDGRAGVRSWDSTDNIGVQAHVDVLDVQPGQTDQEYVATIRVSGNGYNGTGPMAFRLRDGLIAELRIG